MNLLCKISHGEHHHPPNGDWEIVVNCKPERTPEDRRQTVVMLARKFIRENGVHRSKKLTVWTFKEGDPLHPNGQPVSASRTVFQVHRD